MSGWTPLFHDIIYSSVWSNTSKDTKLAWITMLAIADRNGLVRCSLSGLAKIMETSVEEASKAVEVLSSEDPQTITQQFGGRRIERTEDGWKILNWEKYRAKAKAVVRRQQQANAQADYRSRRHWNPNPASNTP